MSSSSRVASRNFASLKSSASSGSVSASQGSRISSGGFINLVARDTSGNISAGMLKATVEAMNHGLCVLLSALHQFGILPSDWKRGLVVPIWKEKEDWEDCSSFLYITLLIVLAYVFPHLLLMQIWSHLLKSERSEQSWFKPNKSTVDRSL